MKHLTKLSVLLLALSVVALCLLIAPTEAEAATSGFYTYTVTDGKVTITDCVDTVTGELVIPSTLEGYPVTAIGAGAFRKCTRLTAVTIPNSITSIGDTAFCECTGLTSITIPSSITTLNHTVFSWCTGLTTVILPDSVTTINDYAFYWCTSLSSVIYCGSEAQWEDVYVGYYNTNFTNAPLSFHNWTEASCTAPKTCTICGDTEGTVAHQGDVWFDALKATCTTDGIKARICEKCNATETVAVPALGHNYESSVVEPTCDQQGYTAYVCSNCDDRYLEDIVAAKGHNWGESVIITEPTCTETGLLEHTCGTCSTNERTPIPALGHTWGEWEVKTKATCTEAGEQTHSCPCGTKETVSIPALGHIYTAEVVAPTCDKQGYTLHTCGNCGHTYMDTPVAATGHVWSAWIQVAAPTCEADGSELRFCNCKASETRAITKLPHTYTDGKCTGCERAMGGYVVLTADMNLTGLTLEEDLYIDLNGFNLSGKLTTGTYKVYGMDSTTDGYTCDNVGLFSCVDEEGNPVVPVTHFRSDITGAAKRYLALEGETGYTFHRIYLAITKVSIRTLKTGFGYKAVFYADTAVLTQVESFGFKMNLSGHTTELSSTMEGSKLTVGKEYSLLLQNFDVEKYGTAAVNAQVFLKLKSGTQINSTTVSYSMQTVLQMMYKNITTMTQTQLQGLRTMCKPFKEIMASWKIDAFLSE